MTNDGTITNDVTVAQLAIKAGDDVILTDDFGREHLTKAEGSPLMLGGHTWVVKVEHRGLYALCRVEPASKAIVASAEEGRRLIERA